MSICLNIYCDDCNRSGGPQPLDDMDKATDYWYRHDWLITPDLTLCPYCNDKSKGR